MLNTQAEEQIYRAYNRDRYFLDVMSCTNHIFIFRSNIDIKNERINEQAKASISTKTKMAVVEGKLGRLVTTKGNCWLGMHTCIYQINLIRFSCTKTS